MKNIFAIIKLYISQILKHNLLHLTASEEQPKHVHALAPDKVCM